MPDDHARRVGALLLEDAQLGRARPARARAWVVIASPVRRAARAAARWTRSSAADSHGLSVPISPMMPGRTRVRPDAVRRLADELVGEVVDRSPVDARLGRVVGPAVPAAAHDHVQAAGPGDRAEPSRVATDAGQRQVDERAAARRAEARELLEDDRLVARELPVVPAAGDLPQRDLRVLVGQRHPEVGGVDRAEDGLDVGHGPRCYPVAHVGSGRSRLRSARSSQSSQGMPDSAT